MSGQVWRGHIIPVPLLGQAQQLQVCWDPDQAELMVPLPALSSFPAGCQHCNQTTRTISGSYRCRICLFKSLHKAPASTSWCHWRREKCPGPVTAPGLLRESTNKVWCGPCQSSTRQNPPTTTSSFFSWVCALSCNSVISIL